METSEKVTKPIQYLNTDLELRSERDIGPILNALGDKVFVLHQSKRSGCYFVSLETSALCKKPGQTINVSCSLIEGLPREVKSVWKQCHSRVLDIGFESGRSPRQFHSILALSTLERVIGIDASIVITIYSASQQVMPNKGLQPTLPTHKPRGQRG